MRRLAFGQQANILSVRARSKAPHFGRWQSLDRKRQSKKNVCNRKRAPAAYEHFGIRDSARTRRALSRTQLNEAATSPPPAAPLLAIIASQQRPAASEQKNASRPHNGAHVATRAPRRLQPSGSSDGRVRLVVSGEQRAPTMAAIHRRAAADVKRAIYHLKSGDRLASCRSLAKIELTRRRLLSLLRH